MATVAQGSVSLGATWGNGTRRRGIVAREVRRRVRDGGFPLGYGRRFRFVVLISRPSAYEIRTFVTVAEVTSTIRGIPSEVNLGKREGLPKKCVANTDVLVTIPKAWLKVRAGALSAEKRDALDEALRFSLGL